MGLFSPRYPAPADELMPVGAVDWHATSVHEAGHVVAAREVGLPVYEVWIDQRKDHVVGRTEVAPNGGTVEGSADQEIILVLGGLEAEAIHRAQGRALPPYRDAVASTRVARRGDVAALRDALADPEASFTWSAAEAEVNRLLARRWQTVERIASALRQKGHLSEAGIRRLV
ncbi:hypothetical protein [Saccharopolyspora cebuensis]|uniref:hypothetical protein n=1 Tax=Saccharopolyspora cebuensis TaxID=418759 RepID=UPI0031EDCFD2